MENMDNFRERFEALERRTQMVEQRLRWWRGLACGFLVLGLLTWTLPPVRAAYDQGDLERRVAELEYKLEYVSGGANEVVITGANLRIVNGLGDTETTNGLGNLIVGYNESRGGSPLRPDVHTGSHNVIVGKQLNFSSFGGLVVGQSNEITGEFASITGGTNSIASGEFASVSGGSGHSASGSGASISGGTANSASGSRASVSGGVQNLASGESASVSGGSGHSASGFRASVSGGSGNVASGGASSVSGGRSRTAPGEFNWAAGPLFADF